MNRAAALAAFDSAGCRVAGGKSDSLIEPPDPSGDRAMMDPPLKGAPKRPCSACGNRFQPTMRRRRLCGWCYRTGEGRGEQIRLIL